MNSSEKKITAMSFGDTNKHGSQNMMARQLMAKLYHRHEPNDPGLNQTKSEVIMFVLIQDSTF